MEPAYVNKHFIALGLDTYFRGNSQELAFCKRAESGGNRIVVTTADGTPLAKGSTLTMQEKKLAPVLTTYHALPKSQRQPNLEDPAKATPARRPVPTPPANGLILRGYCTYLSQTPEGTVMRRPQFYYKRNPDAWAAETQNDTLWMTESEWKALVPKNPKVGQKIEVPTALQRRFYSTIGIDYMEGSVNALPTQKSSMTLQVTQLDEGTIQLTLTGNGQMGVSFDGHDKSGARSRGCHLQLSGRLSIDRKRNAFTRFDLVGLGRAWGNKMNYTKREITLDDYPWLYGIACELVTTKRPVDLLPPYNLVHYGHGLKYFE